MSKSLIYKPAVILLLNGLDRMIGVLRKGHTDPHGLRLLHQYAREHVDLRVPARVQILQRGKPCRLRAAVSRKRRLQNLNSQRRADPAHLIE